MKVLHSTRIRIQGKLSHLKRFDGFIGSGKVFTCTNPGLKGETIGQKLPDGQSLLETGEESPVSTGQRAG
jgi:hypothetical protein